MLAASLLFQVRPERAADVLAAAVLLLLTVNIRNAWDLLLAMARRRSQSRQDGAE